MAYTDRKGSVRRWMTVTPTMLQSWALPRGGTTTAQTRGPSVATVVAIDPPGSGIRVTWPEWPAIRRIEVPPAMTTPGPAGASATPPICPDPAGTVKPPW